MTKILQPVNAPQLSNSAPIIQLGPYYPAPSLTYLNLHLEMLFEVGEEREEDCERQLEDIGDGGDAVLGERHAQVLLDGVDEHLIGAEDGARVL